MKNFKVIFSPRFQQNALDIFSNLENLTKDRVVAQRNYKKIMETALSLDYFPERNQAYGNNRIQQVGNYSIVYRITGDTVEILRVLPSSSQYIAKLRGQEI